MKKSNVVTSVTAERLLELQTAAPVGVIGSSTLDTSNANKVIFVFGGSFQNYSQAPFTFIDKIMQSDNADMSGAIEVPASKILGTLPVINPADYPNTHGEMPSVSVVDAKRYLKVYVDYKGGHQGVTVSLYISAFLDQKIKPSGGIA